MWRRMSLFKFKIKVRAKFFKPLLESRGFPNMLACFHKCSLSCFIYFLLTFQVYLNLFTSFDFVKSYRLTINRSKLTVSFPSFCKTLTVSHSMLAQPMDPLLSAITGHCLGNQCEYLRNKCRIIWYYLASSGPLPLVNGRFCALQIKGSLVNKG